MATIRKSMLILAIVGCALLLASAQPVVHETALVKLVTLIKKRIEPTVDEVIDGFKDYVSLHKRQSELASLFKLSGETQAEIELEYKQVSDVLEIPEVKLIINNIFCVISNHNAFIRDGDANLSAKSRNKIRQAIKDLQL